MLSAITILNRDLFTIYWPYFKLIRFDQGVYQAYNLTDTMCWPFIANCPGIGYYEDPIKYCHNIVSKFDKFLVRKKPDSRMEESHEAPPHVTVCNVVDHTVSEYHAHGITRTIRKYDVPPYHNGAEKGRDRKPKQTWILCEPCIKIIRTPLFGKVLDNFDPDWATKSSSELTASFEGVFHPNQSSKS